MLYIENPKELACMLREVANDHHAYEQLTGQPDANWHEWYASRMFARYQLDSRPLATHAEPLTLGDL